MFYIRGGVQPSNIFVGVKTVPSCCLIALLAYRKKLKHFKEKNVVKRAQAFIIERSEVCWLAGRGARWSRKLDRYKYMSNRCREK